VIHSAQVCTGHLITEVKRIERPVLLATQFPLIEARSPSMKRHGDFLTRLDAAADRIDRITSNDGRGRRIFDDLSRVVSAVQTDKRQTRMN
jgi:hypothetical protein